MQSVQIDTGLNITNGYNSSSTTGTVLNGQSQIFNWTGGTGSVTLPYVIFNSIADNSGYIIHLSNTGAQTLTVNGSTVSGTQSINGASSITLTTGTTTTVYGLGTTWIKI